jgi:hypothetical protein
MVSFQQFENVEDLYDATLYFGSLRCGTKVMMIF